MTAENQVTTEEMNANLAEMSLNETEATHLVSNESDNVQERRDKTLQLKEEGNGHFKSGEYALSVESYLGALQVCPEEDVTTKSILYSNIAAAKDHLEAHDEAIDYCSKALDLNDKHTKALLRRAQLYKKCDKLDESLADYEQYLKLVPDDSFAKKMVHELGVQIQERNEKVKTEMFGKLKDLGNTILKPFGLSTENFQLVKNPENGSYSVNFQNKS